ncbi:MAG TPA: PfkB family carbohydrate kinase, partial [Pyrinomonadaceae bacterium]|nr:PfkB family carbohydrate kinase [Pyrinomonadaceae bacterium]
EPSLRERERQQTHVRFPFNLPAGREFEAVGFGLNAVDHLIVVPAYPAFDTKTRFTTHVQAAGGQTASAMVALKRLGLPTAYAGRFGSDAEGDFGLATLVAEGVNVERAEQVAGARNQIAFIMIDAQTGERTILWDRDERLAYAAEDAPAGFAPRGRVLHLDAHDPPACVRLAREARAAGTIVSADIDNFYEGLPELLPLIDVLITSSEFPRRLTGIADERAALSELKTRLHPHAVVGMTLGARGAILYHEGVFLEAAAFPVPGGCRDTTGAGDAFHAGFLYAMLQGETIEAALNTGCAVAALKCRDLGTRAALPTAPELNQFLTAEGETS